MLGKLLKHEWRAVWKVPSILIGALMILSVVSGIPFIHPLWHSDIKGLNVFAGLIWMMFYVALIGINFGITICLAIHFYKSMFTDEGYLTHTLPVTSHQLLISKILTMMAWTFLGMVGIMVSILIFASMLIGGLKPNDMTLWEAVSEIVEIVTEVLKEAEISLPELGGLVCSIVFLGISGILNSVMVIVGSVSIGQLVSRHKILGSILTYFAIYMAIQIGTGMTVLPVMITNMDSERDVFRVLAPTYWIAGAIAIVISVILYFLSEYLIRNKLNLE